MSRAERQVTWNQAIPNTPMVTLLSQSEAYVCMHRASTSDPRVVQLAGQYLVLQSQLGTLLRA